MKLYSGPLSMFSAKAQIAIAEKALPCEVEYVPFDLKFRYEPKHPEVVRINPKAQVPVLIDGAVELFDSTQIFEYLEHRYTEFPLWPQNAPGRARARLIELQSDEVFFPLVAKLMDRSAAGSPQRETTKQAIELFYGEADKWLDDSEFLAVEYSYADIAFLMAHYFAAFLGADAAPRHVRLREWRLRIARRPAVRDVLASLDKYLRAVGLRPPTFGG